MSDLTLNTKVLMIASGKSDKDYATRIEPTISLRTELMELWKPVKKIPCTVLDPFSGSGTVAGVALAHGRYAILCELNPEYAAMVKKRVSNIKDYYRKKKGLPMEKSITDKKEGFISHDELKTYLK